MINRIPLFFGGLFLITLSLSFTLPGVEAAAEVTIFEALELCVENDVGEFKSVLKKDGCWQIKAMNLNNQKDCLLRIVRKTGIIEFCTNVTPIDLVIGDNTYGFSGEKLRKSKKYYETGMVVNGFRIYKNDSPFFQERRVVFIKNDDGFLAYLMYKGPGLVK